MAAKASTTTVSIDVPMTLDRETKGTFVYTADAEDAPVTLVYVKKAGLPNGAPASITLTVTA